MAVRTDEYLKGKFDLGKYPTKNDYVDLIDSCINTGITSGTEIIVAPVGMNGDYDTDDNSVKYVGSFLYTGSGYSVLTSQQTTDLTNAPTGTCVIVFNTLEEAIGLIVENHYSYLGSNSNPMMDSRDVIVPAGGSVMFTKIGMNYGNTPVVSLVGTAIQGDLIITESGDNGS